LKKTSSLIGTEGNLRRGRHMINFKYYEEYDTEKKKKSYNIVIAVTSYGIAYVP
jgi:hypothetical protein